MTHQIRKSSLRNHRAQGWVGRAVLNFIGALTLLCTNVAFADLTPTSDFVVNGDGTVTHKVTGLTWKRCLEGQIWTGGTCSGTAHRYTFDQASALSGTYAGSSDWRTPSIRELASIVDTQFINPAINAEIFPTTPVTTSLTFFDLEFWSSSPDNVTWPAGGSFAWIADFRDGWIGTTVASERLPVRLVHGGQFLGSSSTPTNDFIDNQNGTVTHKVTGLTWKRCLEGQTWTGGSCSGTAQIYTFEEAIALSSIYAKSLDWRTPSIRELESIVNYGAVGQHSEENYVNKTVFPSVGVSKHAVMSSSLTNNDAFRVFFDQGSSEAQSPSNTGVVLLVRGQRSFERLLDTTAPSMPSAISATTSTANQIHISWTASTDAVSVTSYNIYRNDVLVATLGNVTSYIDTGLTPSTTYGYTITACDAAHNCSVPMETLWATTQVSEGLVVPLITGWNLLGNSVDAPLDVTTAFGNAANVSTVWKWVAASNKWAFFAPSLDDGGTAYAASKGYDRLATIYSGEGFWVNGLQPFTLSLAGTTPYRLSAADLSKGWNLVSTGDKFSPSQMDTTLGGSSASPSYVSMWAWDSAIQKWLFAAPSLVVNGTLSSYVNSKGYGEFGTRTTGNGLGFWLNSNVSSKAPTTIVPIAITLPPTQLQGLSLSSLDSEGIAASINANVTVRTGTSSLVFLTDADDNIAGVGISDGDGNAVTIDATSTAIGLVMIAPVGWYDDGRTVTQLETAIRAAPSFSSLVTIVESKQRLNSALLTEDAQVFAAIFSVASEVLSVASARSQSIAQRALASVAANDGPWFEGENTLRNPRFVPYGLWAVDNQGNTFPSIPYTLSSRDFQWRASASPIGTSQPSMAVINGLVDGKVCAVRFEPLNNFFDSVLTIIPGGTIAVATYDTLSGHLSGLSSDEYLYRMAQLNGLMSWQVDAMLNVAKSLPGTALVNAVGANIAEIVRAHLEGNGEVFVSTDVTASGVGTLYELMADRAQKAGSLVRLLAKYTNGGGTNTAVLTTALRQSAKYLGYIVNAPQYLKDIRFLTDTISAPGSSCYLVDAGTATFFDPLAKNRWVSGGWSDCSGVCGTNNATKSRSVSCTRPDNTITQDSYCTGTKPSTSQACTASECVSYTYAWTTGSWGSCTGSCGTNKGTQSRSVSCNRSDNTKVSDSYCTGTKPSTSQACTANLCSTSGVCGSADGVAVSSKPTTNLCASGATSTVSGTGPWNWSCAGTNGGSPASCTAPQSAATVTLPSACAGVRREAEPNDSSPNNLGSSLYVEFCGQVGIGDTIDRFSYVPSGSGNYRIEFTTKGFQANISIWRNGVYIGPDFVGFGIANREESLREYGLSSQYFSPKDSLLIIVQTQPSYPQGGGYHLLLVPE